MSCWTLLQAPGEAVLVPAGAPHQVLPWWVGLSRRSEVPADTISESRSHSLPYLTDRQLDRAGSRGDGRAEGLEVFKAMWNSLQRAELV